MPRIDDRDAIRTRLCDRAEFLHQLIRINETLTTDSRDLSEDIDVWKKMVDESALELARSYALEQLDQKR